MSQTASVLHRYIINSREKRVLVFPVNAIEFWRLSEGLLLRNKTFDLIMQIFRVNDPMARIMQILILNRAYCRG